MLYFRGTKDFKLERSEDGTTYVTVLEDTFEDPRQYECEAFPIVTYPIGAMAQIIKVTLKNYYGVLGVGLEYIHVSHINE